MVIYGHKNKSIKLKIQQPVSSLWCKNKCVWWKYKITSDLRGVPVIHVIRSSYNRKEKGGEKKQKKPDDILNDSAYIQLGP